MKSRTIRLIGFLVKAVRSSATLAALLVLSGFALRSAAAAAENRSSAASPSARPVVATRTPDADFERGLALVTAGDNRGAVQAFTAVLERAPDHAAAYRERGRVRNRLQEYSTAVADLDAAIQRDSSDAVAFNLRGIARYRLKDEAGAVADYSRAIELDPKYASPLTNRGAVRLATDDFAAAQKDFEQALKLEPRNESALWGRADAKAGHSDFAGAVADYDQALAVNPKNAGVLNNRGQTLHEWKKYPEALQSLNRALAIDPKNVRALANRGLTKIKLDDAAGAEADFKSALALDPENTTAQNGLAEVKSSPQAAAVRKVAATKPEPPPAPTAPPSPVKTTPAKASAGNEPQEPGGGKGTAIAAKTTPAAAKSPAPAAKGAPAAEKSAPAAADATPAVWRLVRTVKAESKTRGKNTTWNEGDGRQGPQLSRTTEVTFEATDGRVSGMLQGEIRRENKIELDPKKKFSPDPNYENGVGYVDAVEKLTEKSEVSWTPPPATAEPGKVWEPRVSVSGKATNLGDNTGINIDLTQEGFAALSESRWQEPQAGPKQGPAARFAFRNIATGENRLVITVMAQCVTGLARYQYFYEANGGVPDDAFAVELVTDPAGRTELRADGRDRVLLRARVKPKETNPAAATAAQAATQGVTFAAEGDGQDWVDFSDTQVRDGWKLVNMQASNPDPARGTSQRPAALQVRARAASGGRQFSRLITLKVAPDPILDAKPDAVELTAQSGNTTEVKLTIENPGPDPWKFRTEYQKRDRALATATVKSMDGKNAVLTLKEAGLDPAHDGTNAERAVLRVFAERPDRKPLEREVRIAVVQEGLFVSATGRDAKENLYPLRGDGSGRPTEIEFRVFAQDPATKKVANLTRRADVLKNVTVECLEAKGSVGANVLEVGKLTQGFAGTRGADEPAGILRLALAKEVPGNGRVVPCEFRITYGGRGEEAFTAIITAGVVTTNTGPGSPDWQVEVARCQEIITKFVPGTYRPKMQALLDQRKKTLGAQGLYQLRHKIWSAAVELTLAEGGSGYADEAKWADTITETLEWTQWAGDMAFGAVIGTVTGPYGALGASSLKTAVISALNAYQEGQSVDDWLWENLCTIPGILEGKIVDVDTFEKLGVNNKAKAWAIFIGYHFCKNLYNGATVVDALKNAAKAAGSDMLATWLGAEVRKSGHLTVSNWAGQKVQEVSTTAKPVVTKTPEPAAQSPAAKPATPEPATTVKSQMPAKTATTPPAPKPIVAADAPNGAKRSDPSVTTKMPDPADAPAPKSAVKTPVGPPAVPASTKVATTKSEPNAQPKRIDAEPAPTTKPGTETGSKVAKTGEETTAGTKPETAEGESKAPAVAKKPVESNASGRVRNRMAIVGGKPFANIDDVLPIMRDPSMVRSLKDAHPQVQEAFSNTREAIYRQHDAIVVQHIKDNVPGMKNRFVKVMEFRTPGATGPSLNTDRDYRACYWAGRDRNTGKDIWVEVDRRHWEDTSYLTFSRLTGGPTDSAEAAKHHAEAHQQLATDKPHPEASPDFSDQKTVWNPQTRQFEKVQIKPNIIRVKEGQPGSRLADPQALGQMYQMKVGDAKFKHEAFVQAQKAVKELDGVRAGYVMQGLPIGLLPPSVRMGMHAVLEVNKKLAADPNRRDPKAIAEAENTLRANGFADLKDFMNKLSNQFESLKLVPAP